MQNPTKNNVRTFVRSLYNARLLEQTEAESVALESHYISLEADGRVAAAEAFHKVINGLCEARKGAQRLEELGYGTLANMLVPMRITSSSVCANHSMNGGMTIWTLTPRGAKSGGQS